MRARSASNAMLGAAAFGLTAAAGPAQDLRFETAFTTRAAPASLYARVLYRTADGVHRLELWRNGDTLLRRDTDGALTAVVSHKPGDAAYRIDLFDHRRRIHAIVDRDSLYRVGRFTDWDDLSHGLRHPVGDYRLRALAGVRAPVAPAAPCRWYELAERGGATRVCWSAAAGFPLEIIDAHGRLVWRALALDSRRVPAATLRPRFAGYVLNDASGDISGD